MLMETSSLPFYISGREQAPRNWATKQECGSVSWLVKQPTQLLSKGAQACSCCGETLVFPVTSLLTESSIYPTLKELAWSCWKQRWGSIYKISLFYSWKGFNIRREKQKCDEAKKWHCWGKYSSKPHILCVSTKSSSQHMAEDETPVSHFCSQWECGVGKNVQPCGSLSCFLQLKYWLELSQTPLFVFSVVEKDGKSQPFPLTEGFWKVLVMLTFVWGRGGSFKESLGTWVWRSCVSFWLCEGAPHSSPTTLTTWPPGIM